MRIIHVEDYFDPTAGYQVNELINANTCFNDEIYIIASNDMSPFHKKVDENSDKEFELKTGAKIIRLDTLLKISSRVILKGLWRTIDELQPDLLFLHGLGDFKDLILWKKKRKYKVVRDCHMSWVASRNKFRKIYYSAFKLLFSNKINQTSKYEVVFALGNEEYEYLTKLGISESKIKYLKHGYNSKVMYYDHEERVYLREEMGYKKDDIVISYIGKFDNYKRPDIIFDIIGNLEQEYIKENNIKLLFIGPKQVSYMDYFNKKLDTLSKDCMVTIDGSKSFSDLFKYFSASDICIFPKETTLSSIHAQICGCPVIMEKHKSNEERVINKSHLYEIDDLVQAKDIIVKIITDKAYIKETNLEKIQSLKDREYENQIAIIRALIKE